jgi:hypothetical protein
MVFNIAEKLCSTIGKGGRWLLNVSALCSLQFGAIDSLPNRALRRY